MCRLFTKVVIDHVLGNIYGQLLCHSVLKMQMRPLRNMCVSGG